MCESDRSAAECLEEDLVEHFKARGAASGQAEVITYDTSVENDLVWGVGFTARHREYSSGAIAGVPKLGQGRRREHARRRLDLLEATWDSKAAPLGTRLVEGSAESGENPKPGVFLDSIEPPPRLTLFGAGDDAQPLARIAHELGWRMTVADASALRWRPRQGSQVFAFALGPSEVWVGLSAPRRRGPLAVVMTHRLPSRPAHSQAPLPCLYPSRAPGARAPVQRLLPTSQRAA